MTQEAALHQFFNKFGMIGYPASSVPEDAELPYLTYTPVSGYWQDTASITVQMWFRTESEMIPNAKANEIGLAIGLGGVILPCDNGAIRLTRGNPFRIASTAQDSNIKLRQLNVTCEFNITK